MFFVLFFFTPVFERNPIQKLTKEKILLTIQQQTLLTKK